MIYVGQTTDFNRRKSQHKRLALIYNDDWKDSNTTLYKTIRANGGWGMFRMNEIKKFPCNDRREALAEEDKTIRELKAVMNMVGMQSSQSGLISFAGLCLTPKEYNKKYEEERKRLLLERREIANNLYK